jgi:hypothetical protein
VLEKWITASGKRRTDHLFPGGNAEGGHPLSVRQLNRLVKLWVAEAGLDSRNYGLLSRTKVGAQARTWGSFPQSGRSQLSPALAVGGEKLRLLQRALCRRVGSIARCWWEKIGAALAAPNSRFERLTKLKPPALPGDTYRLLFARSNPVTGRRGRRGISVTGQEPPNALQKRQS